MWFSARYVAKETKEAIARYFIQSNVKWHSIIVLKSGYCQIKIERKRLFLQGAAYGNNFWSVLCSEKTYFIYLDDIVICCRSFEDHLS